MFRTCDGKLKCRTRYSGGRGSLRFTTSNHCEKHARTYASHMQTPLHTYHAKEAWHTQTNMHAFGVVCLRGYVRVLLDDPKLSLGTVQYCPREFGCWPGTGRALAGYCPNTDGVRPECFPGAFPYCPPFFGTFRDRRVSRGALGETET